jgi:hypothetical protein
MRRWLAGRVLIKIVYLLTRRILGLAVLVFRKDLAKDAELLVLSVAAGAGSFVTMFVRSTPGLPGGGVAWMS